MSRQSKQPEAPYTDVETVEAIASAVCEDLDPEYGPDGREWIVKDGSVWRSDARIVALQPQWFVRLGDGRTTASYFPHREHSS